MILRLDMQECVQSMYEEIVSTDIVWIYNLDTTEVLKIIDAGNYIDTIINILTEDYDYDKFYRPIRISFICLIKANVELSEDVITALSEINYTVSPIEMVTKIEFLITVSQIYNRIITNEYTLDHEGVTKILIDLLNHNIKDYDLINILDFVYPKTIQFNIDDSQKDINIELLLKMSLE